MNIATILMIAAMDKRVLKQTSTSFYFISYFLVLNLSTTLLSSIIITYMLLHQVFSHVLVLVLNG